MDGESDWSSFMGEDVYGSFGSIDASLARGSAVAPLQNRLLTAMCYNDFYETRHVVVVHQYGRTADSSRSENCSSAQDRLCIPMKLRF